MQKTIHSFALLEAIWMPVVLIVILGIQGIRENSLQIFADFWWIIIVVWLLRVVPDIFIRNTKINDVEKTVTYRDGLITKYTIRENALRKVVLLRSWRGLFCPNMFRVTFEEDGVLKERGLSLGIQYTKKNQKIILDKIKEFNPHISLETSPESP